MKEFIINSNDAGQRLDKFMRKAMPELPLSIIYKALRTKNVKVNRKRGKNEPVKNEDLWQRLLKAKEPHQVTFIWVKGHAGHPLNERCDTLATTAADGENLLVDPGV